MSTEINAKLILDIIFKQSGPIPFRCLHAIITKRYKMKMTRAKLKKFLLVLEEDDKLEIIEDLFKYKDNKDHEEKRIDPTDYCYMSLHNKWKYFWTKNAA